MRLGSAAAKRTFIGAPTGGLPAAYRWPQASTWAVPVVFTSIWPGGTSYTLVSDPAAPTASLPLDVPSRSTTLTPGLLSASGRARAIQPDHQDGDTDKRGREDGRVGALIQAEADE
jgi:hypothetical protein